VIGRTLSGKNEKVWSLEFRVWSLGFGVSVRSYFTMIEKLVLSISKLKF
jgi:hypothetical protein